MSKPNLAAVPAGWQQEIQAKHEEQMVAHQERYGLLGRPMTKVQRQLLKADLKAAKQ